MTIHIKSFLNEPFDVYHYVIWKEGQPEALMVNAGRDIEPVVALCQAENLELNHILHTHGFLEFLEGQPPLRDYYDLTAYMSPLDEFWLAHLDTQATILGVDAPPMAFVEQQVNALETLDVAGIQVKVIHTPGNSPGGMSYYLPEANTVFTGDTCYAGQLGATDVPHGDKDTLITTVKEKILTLPDETRIFPGRGPSTTVGAEKQQNSLECVLYGQPLPAVSCSK